jgi:hypothetical protein
VELPHRETVSVGAADVNGDNGCREEERNREGDDKTRLLDDAPIPPGCFRHRAALAYPGPLSFQPFDIPRKWRVEAFAAVLRDPIRDACRLSRRHTVACDLTCDREGPASRAPHTPVALAALVGQPVFGAEFDKDGWTMR